MSYEPTTWANGDIITATKLNNIESGVQSVSSSYTPTTWVNGDIITATKLNNIEQGIANAGGGGGSSDISTAEVTVVNTNESYEEIKVNGAFYVEENELGEGSPAMTYPVISTSEPETLSGKIALYKGGCWIAASSENTPVTVSVSGNATLMGNSVYATGDCTITIS